MIKSLTARSAFSVLCEFMTPKALSLAKKSVDLSIAKCTWNFMRGAFLICRSLVFSPALRDCGIPAPRTARGIVDKDKTQPERLRHKVKKADASIKYNICRIMFFMPQPFRLNSMGDTLPGFHPGLVCHSLSGCIVLHELRERDSKADNAQMASHKWEIPPFIRGIRIILSSSLVSFTRIKVLYTTLWILFTATTLFANREYAADKSTYLLMHLNKNMLIQGQNEKATATLFGDAKFIEEGWSGGALDPSSNGGLIIQTSRPFNAKYTHFSFDARIFLKKYPENMAFIFEKVYEARKKELPNKIPDKAAFGVKMFVDSQGGIGISKRSIYYGSRGWSKKPLHTPKDFRLPLNKWVHIAYVNAGFPIGKVILYVDRKPIIKKVHEFSDRLSYSTAVENTNGKIIIGNNSSKDAAFPGLIDEVRIQSKALALSPPADISWTDPDKKHPLVQGPPYFRRTTIPQLYLSCDKLDEAYLGKDKFKLQVKTPSVLPGVRGNAYGNDNFSFKGDKILNGKSGSVEFWMMPENWNNRSDQNVGIVGIGGNPYQNFYIFNSSGGQRAVSLYFKSDDNKNQFINFNHYIDEQNWHHFVITWKDNRFIIYYNGLPAVDQKLEKIDQIVNAVRNIVTFKGTPNQSKRSRFDEIYLYNQQLSADEAWNAYYRYRDPAKLKKALPYNVSVKQYPGLEKLKTEVDLLDGKRPANIKLQLSQGDAIVKTQTIKTEPAKTVYNPVISYENVKSGEFQLKIEFMDSDGHSLEAITKEFVKKDYPWLNNSLGIPKKVPSPWIPLSPLTAQASDKTVGVKCLLSSYDFDKGLISQINTNDGEQLAGPVDFTPKPLQDQLREIKIDSNGLSAKINKQFTNGDVHIRSNAEMEFDGFIKFFLTIETSKPQVEVDHFSLRIPMKAEEALDYYAVGEHMDFIAGEVPKRDGVFWNSLSGKMIRRHELSEYGAMKKPKKSMIYGNFIPYAWLGNNHRGLCFMADSDKGWVQSDEVPAVSFSREGNVVYLNLNLIASRVVLKKDAPRVITLSLMATPSKRSPKGWRHWKTNSFYVISQAGRVLGDSMLYAPYPVDHAKSKPFMAKLIEQGAIPLPYMDFYGSDARMEPADDFRWEWWPNINSNHLPKGNNIYRSNYCSGSLADWYIHKFDEWVSSSKVNGLYVDNHYPTPMRETVPGPGYVHENGEIQPGYELFAMRDWLKRIYCLMDQRGAQHPYTMIHMTHCMMAPSMSFADIAYEGEDHGIDGQKTKQRNPGDNMDFWPNANIRVVDLPEAYGVGTFWLNRIMGSQEAWKLAPSREFWVRNWYAQLLLHNQRGSAPQDNGIMENFMTFIPKNEKVEFELYRDNRSVVPLNSKDIFISLYKKPNDVLAVICNQNKTAQTVTVNVDKKALRVDKAAFQDYETKKPLKCEHDSFKITIPPRDFKLVLISQQKGQ